MTRRSITILIAALGGEGGGVLTDWIADAARRSGLRVQCTSIPGVAQRTGATTYYVEIARPDDTTALALTPMPGLVDLVVASELVEAARAVQNGYVSPDTTTLIASTHRVYATSEKSAMGDERFDAARALKACATMARRAILFDMDATKQQSGSAISAVMLGAVAASGVLPIDRAVFEAVIEHAGIAVKSSLAGFARAFERTRQPGTNDTTARVVPTRVANTDADGLVALAKASFPIESHYFVEQGIRRLVDYQDLAYARLFVDRLAPIAALESPIGGREHGHRLLCETARHLALRMSFEDLIRVADLKTRASRFERVRADVGAKPGEPVVITEYFKPGLEELSGFLPPRLATRLLDWAGRRGKLEAFNVGVHLRTSGVFGFTLLWTTSKLRMIRRHGHRYALEQRNIEGWLDAVGECATIAYPFGLEMAATARLIKGYSGTYRHGLANFERIVETIVMPAIASRTDATTALQAASAAALKHSGAEIATPASGFKPIAFVRRGVAAKADAATS